MKRCAGVSLIEMLLVIALIAGISALAAATLGGGFRGAALRGAAREVAAQLRFTRTQAIATGRPQRFTLDPATHRWTAAGGRHGEISDDVRVSFIGAREVQPRRGEGAIVFFGDGASTGGRVRLEAGEAAWHVDVAWVTGEVRLRRAESPR